MANVDFKNINALSAEVLRRFGGQLDQVGTLRARWHALLGEPMAGHSEPTLYEGGQLTVTVRSPAWASRLRHQEAGLVRALKSDPVFRGLRELRVRIQPTDPVVKPLPAAVAPTRSRISSRAARMVRSVAETVSDPQLRAALERLADTDDNKT